jgi:hypothetical protein
MSGCGGSTTAAATVSRTYSATVLADHPVAYWRMDETTGNTMADATSNANNGRYVGIYTLGQPGAIAGASAAVAFDGQSGAASVLSSAGLQVNTVTIEAWIKKRADTEYGVYVAKNFEPGGGAGSSWFQLLNSHHNGKLEFRVTSDGAPVVVSNSTLALNTWYYVVATYDGSTANLYINGKPDGTLKVTAVPKQTADPLFLGRRMDGLFNDAALAEVAIYSVALSPERVAAHWQAASGTH